MSNLVTHAERELAMINEDPEFFEAYLNIVRIFAGMGHSGGSADVSRAVISALLSQENLTPLTDSPDEWEFHDSDIWPPNGVWQNRRFSGALSEDGGKTYWLVDEKIAEGQMRTVHTSRSWALLKAVQ